MPRSGRPTRLHRLPQRLDYTLIPAPLDLSLPIVDEKAALPAIIVTPSSPSHDNDFAIAFLLPPPEPTPLQRIWRKVAAFPRSHRRLPSEIQLPPSATKPEFDRPSRWSFKTPARIVVVLALLLFIMGCHVIMHRLAIGRPHMSFEVDPGRHISSYIAPEDRVAIHASGAAHMPHASEDDWLGLGSLWAPKPSVGVKSDPDFIIAEAMSQTG